MKILAVSDLHGCLPHVPECDLLLLGGDYCRSDNSIEQEKFFRGPFTDWLKKIPAKYIIGIAGNHDRLFQYFPTFAKSLPWDYLCDEATSYKDLTVYGTPWTLHCGNWAFQYPTDGNLQEKFQHIPENVDILLSHGPAYRMLDRTLGDRHVGSWTLLDNIKRAKPAIVVHGHVHEARGSLQDEGVWYYNVAYVNYKLEPQYNVVQIPLGDE